MHPVSSPCLGERNSSLPLLRVCVLQSGRVVLPILSCHAVMQEHIEHGLLTAEALQAIVFTPALGDFDALLQLSRDALAAVPCAALGRKLQRAAAKQCGFSHAVFPAPAEAPEDSGKRSRAMLRALPQGESSCIPLANMSKLP